MADKAKTRYAIVTSYLKKHLIITGFLFILIITLGYKYINISTLIDISTFINERQIKISYKDSIFNELLDARNRLDLAISYLDTSVLTRLSFNLTYKDKIPETFADNQELKTDINKTYAALNTAQESAKEIWNLSMENELTKKIFNYRKNDMVRAVELADEGGLKLAETLNKTWQIPSKDSSVQDKIEWFDKQKIYQSATAPQVEFRWSFKKNKKIQPSN